MNRFFTTGVNKQMDFLLKIMDDNRVFTQDVLRNDKITQDEFLEWNEALSNVSEAIKAEMIRD